MCSGGADANKSMDKLFILETSADPNVPLTPDCLTSGSFYTNGSSLCMVLPPLVSPNVIETVKYVTRTFSLTTGKFLYDCCGDSKNPGQATAYDSINNVIWAYDKNTHRIKRWANKGN